MFIAIDIGTKNFIYTSYDPKTNSICSIKKIINKKKLYESVDQIIEEIIILNPTKVFIEKQLTRAISNYTIMHLVSYGLHIRGVPCVLVSPITRGQNIKTYSQRKRYSVDLAFSRIPELKQYLVGIKKKDDVCDTINLLMNNLKLDSINVNQLVLKNY